MMSMFSRLRRSVALFICPELACNGDAMTRLLAETPEGRAALADDGFIRWDGRYLRFSLPKGTAVVALPVTSDRVQASAVAKEPFLPPEKMEDLLASRRHGRIERCKEILKIIHLVVERGEFQESDSFLNGAAERLAVLIFGEKSDDHH